MKKHIIASGVVGLTALGLVPAAAASAAPVAAEWSTAAPDLFGAGDHYVHDRQGFTDDRTPDFEADAGHPSQWQLGGHLVVRLADGGRVLCESSPLTDRGYGLCTSTRLPLGTTRVEALMVSADGRQQSDVSAPVDLTIVPQDPRIRVDDYDAATDTVALSGTTGAGLTIRVGQRVDEPGGYELVTADEKGRWTTTLEHPKDRLGIEAAFIATDDWSTSPKWFAGTYFQRDAPLAPTATHRIEAGRLLLDVASDGADRILVHDGLGKVVAQSPRTGPVTTLTLPAPTAEAYYYVTTERAGTPSLGWADVRVLEGVGVVAADSPSVEDVASSGSQLVVTADALPGAVVTVTDTDGTTLAVKRANGTGEVQLRLPKSSKNDEKLYVSQTMNGTTSDRDDFRVPTA